MSLRDVRRFFTNMDARAVRAVLITIGLLFLVVVVLVAGKTGAFFDDDDAPLLNWLKTHADSPWALPVTILVFTASAFVGFPQILLIAGAVVAFGPWGGFAYSWTANLISALLTFWLGRLVGADTLTRYGGQSARALADMIARNGFVTAFSVRLVPLAPFIIVNMAAGVARIGTLAYLFGTGLGSIPKIAVVSFAGASIMQMMERGDWRVMAGFAAIAAVFLVIMLLVRPLLRARIKPETPSAESTDHLPPSSML